MSDCLRVKCASPLGAVCGSCAASVVLGKCRDLAYVTKCESSALASRALWVAYGPVISDWHLGRCSATAGRVPGRYPGAELLHLTWRVPRGRPGVGSMSFNVSTYVSFCVNHAAPMAPLCIADATQFEDNDEPLCVSFALCRVGARFGFAQQCSAAPVSVS
jgi:hypothetical protein